MGKNNIALLGLLGLGLYALYKYKGGGGGGSVTSVTNMFTLEALEQQRGYLDKETYIKGGYVMEPTPITYNQNLLSQPTELENLTWKSGTSPQDRQDQWWNQPPPTDKPAVTPVTSSTPSGYTTGGAPAPVKSPRQPDTSPQSRPDKWWEQTTIGAGSGSGGGGGGVR